VTALLKLAGISKSFPGCLANDQIDIEISSGEIHALLGQNGAGKSTLVKIMYGLLQADAGTLEWQQQAIKIRSPAHARQLGIAMVFQHFSLFDSMTVLENIVLGLGDSGNSQSKTNRAALKDEIVRVADQYGLPLQPDRHVYSLSVGEKQRIEIIRCLLQSPELLIMDEPTSVLTPQEVESLFTTLRRLRDDGMSILYISHKLDEIHQLCDRATILRDGRKVAVADPRKESSESLAEMMIGEKTLQVERDSTRNSLKSSSSAQNASFSDVHSTPGQSAEQITHSGTSLQVRQLNVAALSDTGISLQDISFEVNAGEVLGIAGVAGNGQDELMLALSGESLSRPGDSITLSQGSNPPLAIGQFTPGMRRRNGVCVIPEERLGHAAVPSMTLAENALLTGFERLPLTRAGWIRKRAAKAFARQIVETFNVMCRDVDSTASNLSGGNIQKFVVGREIEQDPAVLIVAQPTWGVDAGAAAVIRQALLQLAHNGAAVLVISQDLDELLQISDRIVAMCAGSLSEAYAADALTAAEIGILMGGGRLTRAREQASA